MSRETSAWLNQNVLRGFTDKRGYAWHYSMADQGDESNHYPGAIPIADVYRRLFNWQAEPRKLFMEDGAGGLVELPNDVAWARSDDRTAKGKLGLHTDKYGDHQYGEWCVTKVENMIDDEIQIANAGLLKNGAIAWVQIETPDNIVTPEGVSIRPFILATTSFDGSIASTYKDGFTDTVCDNTRDAFLREAGNVYRVKHTKNARFDVLSARQALNIIHANTDAFAAEIAALCATDVTNTQWSKFVEAHVPIDDEAKGRGRTVAENKRADLTELYRTDVRVAPWAGTAWGVIQAVNTYAHHMGTVRNVTSRFERNMLRVVKGETATGDRMALATLESVLGAPIVRPEVTPTLTFA